MKNKVLSPRPHGKNYEAFLEFRKAIDEGKKMLYVGPGYVVMSEEMYIKFAAQTTEMIEKLEEIKDEIRNGAQNHEILTAIELLTQDLSHSL